MRSDDFNEIGIDIIEISRIQKLIGKYGEDFLKLFLTEKEIHLCEKAEKIKGRIAAMLWSGKEAILKALKEGITGKITPLDIELTCDDNYNFKVNINEKATKQIHKITAGTEFKITISISSSTEEACAVAFITSESGKK